MLNVEFSKIMYNSEEKSVEEEEDLYLSDIHIENEASISTSNGLKVIRIEFSLPTRSNNLENVNSEFDNDGDLVINRRSNYNKHIFMIELLMKTSLRDVGYQLWRASYFLADFIIEYSNIFHWNCIVDLGAGLGITSLVSALFARKVFCTDLSHIVEISKRNFKRNKHEIKPDCNVIFKGRYFFLHFYKYNNLPVSGYP